MFLAPIFSSAGVDVGYIGHSLRFRGAQHLSRTFGAPTSNTGWALSLFDKRGTLSTVQSIFSAGDSDIRYNVTTATISFVKDGSVVATSSAVFRDPTGFIHLFIRSNGTNIKAYRNTEEILSYTGTIPDLNSAIAHTIGKYAGAATEYFDGYRARIAFVDNGGSLTPQDFIRFNSEINEWVSKTQAQVKAVVDAGGANSTMLDFDNGTSLTTLGYDNSSKGNNWTLNGFSLTAGINYDWMLDVPGNTYATLNPLSGGTVGTVKEGNLTYTSSAGTYNNLISTLPITSGMKAYWELKAPASWVNNSQFNYGVARPSLFKPTSVYGSYLAGVNSTTAGTMYRDGTILGSFGYTLALNDLVGLAYDFDAGTLDIYVNNSLKNTITGISVEERFAFLDLGASLTAWVNFGQQPFAYTPPSGYKAICQANLPTPAILNPTQHFQAKLDTGANIKSTSEAVFPSNFLEWIKDRANSDNYQLIDIVRGSSAVLQSNTTAAETTYSAPSGSSVGWTWKAGGAPVTNNAGSIRSRVSANVEAGFSIVTYTGTGANATVGHGLRKAPGLMIAKQRSTGTTENWAVYNGNLANTEYALLNSTAAKATGATYWNSTAPTTYVFSIGTTADTNESAKDFVAYCFAEIPGYSKIGSYTGNGSADGSFVYCGFKPKYVLVKCSSSTGSWRIYDAARPGYNVIGGTLLAEGTGAETTAAEVDFTASGFKLRIATDPNAAQTYIFYAVADVAAKYSLGR